MNQVKIAFFDIDGTLIDMNKKQISQKMLRTLKALQEQNIILCIATGRSPITLPDFGDVNFDAFLTFNGSYCFNQEETLYKNPIPRQDINQIVANARALKRPVAIATSDQIIANGQDADLVDYFAFARQEVIVSDEFEQLIANEPVFQVMLGSRQADYAQVMKNTTASQITAWWDRAVDIIPTSSGKGTAIAKILAHYGLDKSQAIAFGDGNNDIEMLEAVGWGLAMANASTELKAVADEVIGHGADDGISQFCVANGLIEKL